MADNNPSTTSSTSSQQSKPYKRLGWTVFVASVLATALMVTFMFRSPFNDGSGHPDAETFSFYATFVGGICAIAFGILNGYLIYRTYAAQQEQAASADEQYNKTMTRQVNFFETERFEGRFYEMMRANRKIVEEMRYEVPDEYIAVERQVNHKLANKHHIILIHGQRVFVQIYKHIQEAKKECAWIRKRVEAPVDMFKDPGLYSAEKEILVKYYRKLGLNIDVPDHVIAEIQWVNIIYQCIFFGVTNQGIQIIAKNLEQKYDNLLVNQVIRTLRLKPVIWSDHWPSYENLEKNDFIDLVDSTFIEHEEKKYTKYYGGHQHRLGHYFRNTYNLYKYLDDTNLSWPKKYSYSKQFRSQLSTYEQAIFFYNSLSMMGRVWEIEGGKDLEGDNKVNKKFITKYNLVKNIPSELLSDEKLNTIYPLVDYELQPKSPFKKILEEKYK